MTYSLCLYFAFTAAEDVRTLEQAKQALVWHYWIFSQHVVTFAFAHDVPLLLGTVIYMCVLCIYIYIYIYIICYLISLCICW